MARYIDKIGVELEIAVDKPAPTVKAFNREGDGSIHSNGMPDKTAREYVSEPISYKSDWDNSEMSKLESGIYKLYKKHGASANSSMGMHMHVSFYQDFYYYSLASEKFRDFFIERLKDSELYESNAQLRERVEGVNYSKPIQNHKELQAQMERHGSRYRHFAYRPSMQTIEFRVMPAFNSKREVMDAIDFITSTINSYLFNKEHEFEEESKVEGSDIELGLEESSQNLEKKDVKEVFNSV